VQCFADGEASHNHQPATHPFRVIEQNSVPIYDKNWGADEEMLLLEGAEIYGLGSWADIADHIGGYRNKDEVRAHYSKIDLESPNFPLPVRASPHDLNLLEEVPREEFQARKKRRIEERKESSKNAPPATPKKKPTASVPACHEVQGYMPGRLEFETEYCNDAEEAVQLMQFDPGEGVNPRTGELEPEMELKMTVMDIYNSRLTQRADRKKVIFEHNLLEYRKNAALDKKRTKEERDLLNKAKPFGRMMNHDDFEEFNKGLIDELNLRQAISQLQDWREKKITDLRGGEKYEQDKAVRAQKAQPMGSLDRERFASGQRAKPAPIIETPSGAAALVAPDLPIRLFQSDATPSTPPGRSDKALANGYANGTLTPQSQREKFAIQPLSGVSPLPMTAENAADMHLLTPEEVELCEKTRINPKPYLAMKEAVMKEALKGNGQMKKKQAKEICKVEPQKGGRIFDFFVNSGWISKT
jgi:transcriptional adapter 2-alpha